ncbi:MAG: hypothetical protein GC189_12990 [Alphaproteobacteria bacterium]|nr:hypothetical protein [Alphaproteobacteria bacterium]
MIWTLSRKASDDIDSIIRCTDAHFGAQLTEDYLGGLYNSFDLLADNPRMGRAWSSARRCYIYR